MKTNKKLIGRIESNKNRLYFKTIIGDCEINEKEVELAVSQVTHTPILTYKQNTYFLSWEEIVQLAIDAGLLNEVTK